MNILQDSKNLCNNLKSSYKKDKQNEFEFKLLDNLYNTFIIGSIVFVFVASGCLIVLSGYLTII